MGHRRNFVFWFAANRIVQSAMEAANPRSVWTHDERRAYHRLRIYYDATQHNKTAPGRTIGSLQTDSLTKPVQPAHEVCFPNTLPPRHSQQRTQNSLPN